MKQTYKPKGYSTVSPYLVVDGARGMIDFLVNLFNGTEKRVYSNADGAIIHSEVLIDDSVIMIADANEQFPAQSQIIHIYVEDVDKLYKKALEMGCKGLDAPKSREGDPDKRGAFKDPNGIFWSVATQL